MNIEFSAEDEVFREEVKNFLSTNLTDEMRREAERTTTVFADKDLAMKWQEILVEKGWAVPAWPVEHGGVAWTPNQKYIWGQECAKSHAPGLIPLGLRMLAPVLFKYGTPEQKAEYLPKILSGEQYWCQGYSEPGSGSDLSSLKTSAVKDGDDYVVNGTKIWTTHAHFADHIFCLVRTDTGVKPQAGITFLLIPLDMPGITVKPIITIADDHEVNQVFLMTFECRSPTALVLKMRAGPLLNICSSSSAAAVVQLLAFASRLKVSKVSPRKSVTVRCR